MDQHPATLKDRLQFVLYADEQVLAKDLAAIQGFLTRLDSFLDARLWRSLPDSSAVAVFKGKELQDFEKLCRIIAESEARIYDKRARTLQKTHPLAIQVNLDTGVANGVIVVRDKTTCAELIWRILTNNLQFDVNYNSKTDCWELIEQMTESVFRVVTKNAKLTNSFWNFYPERNL